MLYAIVGEDAEGSLPLRRKHRPAHLARVAALRDAARLVLAGPFPALDTGDPGEAAFTGSLIVAEFPSLEEACAWAEADPYSTAGVWRQVTTRPFLQVLP